MESGKVILTEAELQKSLGEKDYQRFHDRVVQLVAEGKLEPIKASKTNGRMPSLFNRYRVLREKDDYSRFRDEIRQLHPRLNIAGYLAKPSLFARHREVVEALSRYLWHHEVLLQQPMSRKERSFSIWGREKFIDSKEKLIYEAADFNHLTENFLNYFETPEPFFEYVPKRRQGMTVVILENKDTWFTFRKLIQERGQNRFAGTEIDALLYGEGNKITQAGKLADYCATAFPDAGRFLYFGDLDLEGIRIFWRTREGNPQLPILPYIPMYQLMIELSRRVDLPQSPDQRDRSAPLEEFLQFFSTAEASKIKAILTKGRYIPQEIVNYQVLSNLLGRE